MAADQCWINHGADGTRVPDLSICRVTIWTNLNWRGHLFTFHCRITIG